MKKNRELFFKFLKYYEFKNGFQIFKLFFKYVDFFEIINFLSEFANFFLTRVFSRFHELFNLNGFFEFIKLLKIHEHLSI